MNKKLFLLYIIILILLIIISQLIIPKQKQENTSFKNQLKKISFYKKENLSRYLSYKQNNYNLSIIEVVTNVNIGLDNPYYQNIKETKYKDTLTLVNKYNNLNENYIPNNLENINPKYSTSTLKLVSEAKLFFEKLAEDALKENLYIIAMSAYRSYSYQETLYNRYVQNDGIIKADSYSARPGHSEHQTGLAIDIQNNTLTYTEFDKTNEYIWMQENAHKYGFILRYPKDKTDITGYSYEPWHYRYIGIEHATFIHENNLTFDEYYIQYLDK